MCVQQLLPVHLLVARPQRLEALAGRNRKRLPHPVPGARRQDRRCRGRSSLPECQGALPQHSWHGTSMQGAASDSSRTSMAASAGQTKTELPRAHHAETVPVWWLRQAGDTLRPAAGVKMAPRTRLQTGGMHGCAKRRTCEHEHSLETCFTLPAPVLAQHLNVKVPAAYHVRHSATSCMAAALPAIAVSPLRWSSQQPLQSPASRGKGVKGSPQRTSPSHSRQPHGHNAPAGDLCPAGQHLLEGALTQHEWRCACSDTCNSHDHSFWTSLQAAPLTGHVSFACAANP